MRFYRILLPPFAAAFLFAQDSPADIARRLAASLMAGDFEKATASFDDRMNAAIKPDGLAKLWKGLTAQMGPARQAGEPNVTTMGELRVAVIPVLFERGKIEARVVVSPEGKVSGLNFTPAAAPTLKLPDGLTERETTIGDGQWELSGTVTLPKSEGLVAGVVLVHGSGPQDRDETIASNKPFRDIAWGLAERGIAVLRYDKRTRRYGAQLAASGQQIGLNEETVDDAVAALEKLRDTAGIDPKRVFVLGHSLGGTLAPRIATRAPWIAGAIVVAGSARPFREVLLEQLEYLGSLPGNESEPAKEKLAEMKAQARRIGDAKVAAEERILGASAGYWRELESVKAAEEAAALKQPMLILQGERDYQVTMNDFALWKKALGDRPSATLKSFPKLNHLLIEGEGKSKPAEYAIPARVAAEPLDDIASWIGRVRVN